MKTLLFLAMLLLPAGLSAQTVYKWKDEKGQWVFSQNPPAGKNAERVDMPAPEAGALKNESCEPFKVGEIRSRKEVSKSGASVLVEDFQIKLLDQTATKASLGWSARLRNQSTAAEQLSLIVDLFDCQGFKLGGGTRDSALAARQVATLSDTVILTGSTAATVGRFSLRLGTSVSSADSNSAPSQAVSTESKAEVVVMSQRIESNNEGFWLVGRVRNRGRAPARNIRLTYKLRETSGAEVPGGSFYLDGSDLAPGAHAGFRHRLPQLHARSRVTAIVEAESQ